jgi:hypothetical protein
MRIYVGRQGGERLVDQPHGEAARTDGVVEDGIRLLPAVAGDLDAVGLTAHGVG